MSSTDDAVVPTPLESGSLASRMRVRAGELENAISEVFAIPTWEEILAVELRLVSWEALRKVVSRHERLASRNPAMHELYIAADQLILGTEQFFEVSEAARTPVQHTWNTLARMSGKNIPEDASARQSIIVLCGDTNVLLLWKEWQDWMATRRTEVEEDMVKDFGTTQ